jgi:hypothetical protein
MEDTPVNDIDPLIASAALIATLATSFLASHPELLIVVPT